jgi:type II secretory pathway pseudopilin PulG
MKTPSHPFSTPRRGATLVEAIIALAVLAFGLTGFTTAMIASAQQDRRNSARAAAKEVAGELAREISTWLYNDPRLQPVSYSVPAPEFSQSVPQGGTVTQGAPGVASTIAGETLNPPPDYTDASLALGASRVRPLAVINAEEPGHTYVFNRYWNVTRDPNNSSLTMVTVYVTFSPKAGVRDVVTTYTSVVDQAAFSTGNSFGAF